MTRARRLVAEGLGTAMLLAVVVGSGIMAERLAAGNAAIALLANALATGAGLVALIPMFGARSSPRNWPGRPPRHCFSRGSTLPRHNQHAAPELTGNCDRPGRI